MPLLVFNLTASPVTLAAGHPVRIIPASSAPPARGPSFNVTAELRPNLTVDPAHGISGGLTAANFTSLQAQVTGGSVVYEWTDDPEYLTGALVISGPVPAAHAITHRTGQPDALAIGGTTATNNSVTATNQSTTATNQTTMGAYVYDIGTPVSVAAASVHAAFAGNDASNDFPGPFTSPDVPRNVSVTFGASWDGSNVSVSGMDQFNVSTTESFTSTPGSTITGTKIFKSVTSAAKGTVGSNADTASIGVGQKFGLTPAIGGAYGIVTVDGVSEAGTWDATYSAVTPTTGPDGSKVMVAMASSNHNHTQDAHNHTQDAHNHTQNSHAHNVA